MRGSMAGPRREPTLGGIIGASDADAQSFHTVIRGKLEKDTSALLLLADEEIVDRMLQELGPSGIEKLRRTVSDELRGNLEAAVRVVAQPQAEGAPAH
jgi:uncharacterized membrane protein